MPPLGEIKGKQTEKIEPISISFHLKISVKTPRHYSDLTLILPTPKLISLCHQYRARPPACTSVQSDQAQYCWLTVFKFSS